MKKLSHITYALLISSFPLLGLANDPKEGKNAEKEGETTLVEESKMSVQNDTPKNQTETVASSKEELMEINQDSILQEETSIDNLSKFNYLFYFIYKHKYKDKVLIEQELEDTR